MNDECRDLLQYFTYEHLKDERLKAASAPFCELAREVANPVNIPGGLAKDVEALAAGYQGTGPSNPEAAWVGHKLRSARMLLQGAGGNEMRVLAMRMILEAKDCAVRAVLYSPSSSAGGAT